MAKEELTLVYAYYDNASMLALHADHWRVYPGDVKIIVVDDGSPNKPALDVLKCRDLKNVSLYRINENIPWNQNGARNLGMSVCDTSWAMMLDMDHLLPAADACVALLMEKKAKHYYVPRRVWPSGEEYKRHPNTFLLERAAFFECGGYDEDFCGYYGSDAVFRKSLDTVAKRVELDNLVTVHYEGIIPDANTVEFGRKESEFHSARHSHLQAKRAAAPYKAENPLRFTWGRQL